VTKGLAKSGMQVVRIQHGVSPIGARLLRRLEFIGSAWADLRNTDRNSKLAGGGGAVAKATRDADKAEHWPAGDAVAGLIGAGRVLVDAGRTLEGIHALLLTGFIAPT
jgi:hypothetical protein